MTDAPHNAAGRCARCGASLADTTADALCVRCLLTAALASDMNEADEAAALLTPETLLQRREFAGYELLGEIARGGMGVVFRARQPKLGRQVALKVIAAGELASPRMVERFRTEAEAEARLQHPNIVPILEVGHHDGWHYFSMRFIEGGTLATRMQQGRMPPKAAARLIVKVARAVHHAHQHGVLHRDLKPTNILLDAQGEPQLTDFGLAKVMEDSRDLTLSAAVLGTPAYMAPEQALGQTRDVTVAADVYGLGAVLYEMLAGRPPFAALNTHALLRKVTEEDAPSFRAESATDRDLEVICLKCLEKDPVRRYGSAAELADDLERWLRGEPVLARGSTAWERGAKWTRRHPAKAALAVLVPSLLLVITAGSLWFNVSLSQSRRALAASAQETRRELVSQHLHEASLLSDAHNGYAAMLPLAEALRLEQPEAGAVPPSLERLQLTWQFSPRLQRMWDARGIPVTLAFSPDNARLTAVMRNGGERIWDLASGREISATESGPNPTTGPRAHVGRLVSADGRWVAAADGRTTRISDARSGAALFQVTPSNAFLDQDFSPDGKYFATAAFADQAQVRTVPEGTRHQFPIRHHNGANRVLFSPDGRLLATAGFDYQVRVHYARELRQTMPTIQHGALVEALTFSADGRFLATGDAWGNVRVFDLFLRQNFVPPGATVARGTALRADGKFAVLVGNQRQLQLWDIAAQRPAGDVMNSRGTVAQTVFAADGRQLAVACGKEGVQVWDVPASRVVLDLPDVGYVTAVAFHPDGTKLLVVINSDSAQIWDIAQRRPVGPVLERKTLADGRPFSPRRISGAHGSASAWSPDGKWIVMAGGINYVTVWDAATGQPVGDPILADVGVRAVDFSPDHQRFVLAFNDRNIEPAAAQMYELPTLRPLGPPLMHGDGVVNAKFSPAGEVLATAGEDSVVRLWRVADGRPAAPDFRHGGILIAQTFQPNLQVMATAAYDASIRLWDTSRGELMAPPLVLGYAPQTVEFTRDGATLMFGSSRGAASFFRFRRVNWPAGSWHRLAVCLNGVKLDDRSRRIVVAPCELAETFAGLQAAQPEDFAWNTDAAGWHQQCAAAAELQGGWFTAVFHLQRLAALTPDDASLPARLTTAKQRAN
ncbi:MAG: hypothetical protein RL514_1498 [Verrucomicrobiota bacterium]|jgi:WD40 repeat protein/tRNA A-37 threonylcarbamoyl transferase component Bud32